MNVRQVVPKDAIPSVDAPEFGSSYFGDPDDEVIVVEGTGGLDGTSGIDGTGGLDGTSGIDGTSGVEATGGNVARAYPIRVLNYHEIVNDDLGGASGGASGAEAGSEDSLDGGDPIAVTWCPLCGSAVVYDREVGGRVLEFGVSGKLADDDLVMYDRETGSEWKQSLGEAIAGELEGEELTVRSSGVMTYDKFRDEYPDGEVLQRPGGTSEASGPGEDPEPIDYDDAPYADYFESEGFGLGAHRGSGGREWDRDDLDPKTAVLGVEASDESDDELAEDALGFPLPHVERAGGVAHATVGGREVVTFATPDGIHAFENPGFEFELVESEDGEDGTAGAFEADSATWDGATGESDDGRELERVAARRLFAFAWQDDHGPESFWTAD